LLSLPLLLSAASASAISITPPPGSGLGPDDGSEIYCTCDQDPNPLVERHVMTVREGFDAFSATTPHEWGFYFVDDPSTLIPIFTASEVPVGGLNPSARVDFDLGTVQDLDTLEIEYSFAPQLGKIGFYIRVDLGREPILSYSQAALNGGVDTFGSFPSTTSELLRVVAFEIDGRVLSLETVHGVCNVIPEPSVALLLGGGLVLLASRRRS
jgi:hypothetical protein